MKHSTRSDAVVARLFRRSGTSDEEQAELPPPEFGPGYVEGSSLDDGSMRDGSTPGGGGVEPVNQGPDEPRGGYFLETVLQDIRFALRVLRRSPGFSIVSVSTLALAIGANAVVFGILNALILRPLNVPQAESLYGLEHAEEYGYQSYPNYLDLRNRNRSFEGLAAYKFASAGLDTGKDPSRLWGFQTSGNYFDVLGAQPYLGRFFHASDEHGPNSAPFIVLTYSFWRSHFDGDRGTLGRVVRLNKHPFTILGVTSPGFHGTLLFFSPDFFMPIVNQEQIDGESTLNARGSRGIFEILGHLKSGVTPAQSVTDLNAIGTYLETAYPKEVSHATFSLVRPGLYGSFLGPSVRGFVAGLTLLAGMILLAACANLGSLFAARATDRSREIALRLALGSSRKRILRQIFTEAVLVSLAGGTLGLAGSVVLLHQLSKWQPFPRFPINVPVSPDAKVYLVALALALVSAVLFGIVPVRQVLRTTPYEIVKGAPAAIGRRITMRDCLLVIQIAICAVLVTSSMVAVRGLIRSLHSKFGFEPQNTMLANTDLKMAGYSGDSVPAMQRRMIEEMETIPGVQRVALISYPPLGMAAFRVNVFRDETTDLRQSNVAVMPYNYVISPGYFEAAGTSLLAGRAFSWHDDKNAPAVAVVNREFARKMSGSVNKVLGNYYKLPDGKRVQVVGVVEDGRYLSLTEDPQPAIFLPIVQSPSSQAYLVERSARDPQRLIAAMRSKLRELDPGLPAEIETWSSVMDGAMFPSRVATVSLGLLGVMGSMLSITGIFGMAAYSVSKRLRELGIRVSLGAQRKDVLFSALGRAFKLLAFGSVAGLILGVLATRVLSSIVYQATPRDPLIFGGVTLTMLLLGLLATWIPAQRALAVNPVTLLREE